MSTKPLLERLFDMVEIRCGACGKVKKLHSGLRHHLPPEMKLKKLHTCGWHIDKRLATLDRCPECLVTEPPAPQGNGHDHKEEPPGPQLWQVFDHVINLSTVDWRENENMFTATVVAMLGQLELVLENNYALLRQDHRAQVAAALKDLVETAQLADILTIPPTGTEQQPEIDAHPVLNWLESLP